MKNINKIKKEIEAMGLRVKIQNNGLNIHPPTDGLIFTDNLNRILFIADTYNLRRYLNFNERYLRLHGRLH